MEYSFDEVANMLDEMAERFPPVFFEELNGGILLENRSVTGQKRIFCPGCLWKMKNRGQKECYLCPRYFQRYGYQKFSGRLRPPKRDGSER